MDRQVTSKDLLSRLREDDTRSDRREAADEIDHLRRQLKDRPLYLDGLSIDQWREHAKKGWEMYAASKAFAHEPRTLHAPIDGPFEVWFKPIDGTRVVLDDRNGITIQVHGFVDADEHRKYCEELANTLNARSTPPPPVALALLREIVHEYDQTHDGEVDEVGRARDWSAIPSDLIERARGLVP